MGKIALTRLNFETTNMEDSSCVYEQIQPSVLFGNKLCRFLLSSQDPVNSLRGFILKLS